MLKGHGDKISGTERTDVETAVADAKKSLEGTDAAAMNTARERLTQASHKLAEVMYRAQQAPGATPEAGGPQAAGSTNGSGGAGQQQKKDEGVIDAEYVDVEDKK